MKDSDCVGFLQWALPRLRKRWPGFRKVRKQVCKRLQRRMHQLGLPGVAEYRAYLERNSDEWAQLDSLCRITISRFYRDKGVFRFLEQTVIPILAGRVAERDNPVLRIWSAGCGSGEEPYSIALLWCFHLHDVFPRVRLNILATDIHPQMIQRATKGVYPPSSLKNLPPIWRHRAFAQTSGLYCLLQQYRNGVHFLEHDIRAGSVDGPFDLILCRNLVFTYFDEPLQLDILRQFEKGLTAGGGLVIGIHEQLPQCGELFSKWSAHHKVFRS